MNLGGNEIVLVVVLIATAVAILAISDRQRRKKTDWRFVILLLLAGPALVFAVKAGWLQQLNLRILGWGIGVVVFLVIVVNAAVRPWLQLRRLRRMYGNAITGLPQTAWRNAKTITLLCPRCQQKLTLDIALDAGVRSKCPACGTAIMLQSGSAPLHQGNHPGP